ncbi:hypothetical protein TURTL08_15230 [Turicimonas sp. TL08]
MVLPPTIAKLETQIGAESLIMDQYEVDGGVNRVGVTDIKLKSVSRKANV